MSILQTAGPQPLPRSRTVPTTAQTGLPAAGASFCDAHRRSAVSSLIPCSIHGIPSAGLPEALCAQSRRTALVFNRHSPEPMVNQRRFSDSVPSNNGNDVIRMKESLLGHEEAWRRQRGSNALTSEGERRNILAIADPSYFCGREWLSQSSKRVGPRRGFSPGVRL